MMIKINYYKLKGNESSLFFAPDQKIILSEFGLGLLYSVLCIIIKNKRNES